MTSEELMEALADKEHDSWANWMRYLISQCGRLRDGSVIIPPERVAHWERQIATPSHLLSEKEKESDREEVRKILPIIDQYVGERVEAYRLELFEQIREAANRLREPGVIHYDPE